MRERLAALQFEYKAACHTAKATRLEVEEAKQTLADTVTAQQIVQQVSLKIQQQIHLRLARVVSQCLEIVFETPYTFQIHFEKKRGRTEARMVFLRNGIEVDPMTASGGGVVDVAAFALRVAALVLTKPTLRRLVVLDEPFKFVSAEYRPYLTTVLNTLADKMGVQFILVTHLTELQIGNVIEVE